LEEPKSWSLPWQDLVPYMVRRQFSAAAPAPPLASAVPGPPREGSGDAQPGPQKPEGGEEGSRCSSAASESGPCEGDRLVAAACERYLGTESGLGLGPEPRCSAASAGGACSVYVAGAECFCARAASVQAYADINRRVPWAAAPCAFVRLSVLLSFWCYNCVRYALTVSTCDALTKGWPN